MASDERREVGRLYSVSAWGLACSGEVLVAFNIFGLLGKPSYKSAESFKANMEKIRDFYASIGLDSAKKQVISVEELYPKIAMARTKDELYSADNSLIAELEHVYLLRLPKPGWKAITAVAGGEMEA